MPQCSDYGEGWSGDYPNCVYGAPSFDPTVGSLGFQDILPAQVEGIPWAEFFDPYDPARQEMAEAGAGIDIGQLQSAWGLQQQQLGEAYGLRTGQLGETWGGRRTELGAGAGRGVRGARRTGEETMRRGRMATQEQAGEAARFAEADVMAEYRGGIQAGQTAYEQALGIAGLGYEQALETGELGVTQATTDIYQGLGEDIYGFQQEWEREQRSTLNVLLGMGLWDDDNNGNGDGPTCPNVTCPDGTCEDNIDDCSDFPPPSDPDPQTCAEQGLVECTDPNANNYGLCGACDYGE